MIHFTVRIYTWVCLYYEKIKQNIIHKKVTVRENIEKMKHNNSSKTKYDQKNDKN